MTRIRENSLRYRHDGSSSSAPQESEQEESAGQERGHDFLNRTRRVGAQIRDFAQTARGVGLGAAAYGNVQFLAGMYRGSEVQYIHGLAAMAAGATVLSGEALTQILTTRYFRHSSTPTQDLHNRLRQLRISEDCLYQATDMITFANQPEERPVLSEGEGLILADYLADLIAGPSDLLHHPQQQSLSRLERAVRQAGNDPVRLIENLLGLLRSSDPLIPSSGRRL